MATAGLIAVAIGTPVAFANSTSTRADAVAGASASGTAGTTAAAVTETPLPTPVDTNPPAPIAPTISPIDQTLDGVRGLAIAPVDFVAHDFLGIATFRVSSTLPAGITLDPHTGVLSGTPTIGPFAGVYTVTAEDATDSVSTSLTLRITAPTPTIAPQDQSLRAYVNVPISPLTFTPDGFSEPPRFSVSPDLPPGISLDPNSGILSGAPTSGPSTGTFTVTAATKSDTVSTSLGISVRMAKPSVTPPTQLVNAVANQPIVDTWTMSPKDFGTNVKFLTNPPLPDGLTISSQTGVISGTPTLAQTLTEYLIVAGDGTDTAEAKVLIEIKATLSPATQSVAGNVGTPVQPKTLVQHGLSAAARFEISPTGDPLPKGLQIDAMTGAISGTPAVAQLLTTSVIQAKEGLVLAESSIEFTIACADPLAPVPECTAPAPVSLMSFIPNPGLSPHVSNSPTTVGSCATCHRTHSTKASYLGKSAITSSALCATCHANGAGAYNINSQYATPDPNNLTTGNIFEHRPSTATDHTTYTSDDDGASVPRDDLSGKLKRTSECVDCHNPHDATPSEAARDGGDGGAWLASGQISGASAVEFTGTTYNLLGGIQGRMKYEYQLCFKCHSAYTLQPSYERNAAAEFATTNGSYHPVEGPGKTQNSAKLTSNLQGGTTWKFTSGQTIRCLHCHASDVALSSTGETVPSDIHSVKTTKAVPAPEPLRRGILLDNYRQDTATVKTTYKQSDYALCFRCHSSAPFNSSTNVDTNFEYHYYHVQGEDYGCPVCHNNLHSPQAAKATQAISGRALVSFSSLAGSNPSFNSTAAGSGNCTVSCHGNKSYTGKMP